MRIPAPLIAIVAAAAIAGCSGGSAVAPTMGTGTQSVIHHSLDYSLPHTGPALSVKYLTTLLNSKSEAVPNAGCGSGSLMYASQYYTNTVQIYKQAGTSQSPCASLTTSIVNPQGMYVDTKNNVWVANTGANNVVMFAKGGTTIKKTLSDPGQYPVDVCIGSTGNVYATNIITTGGGPGSLEEWVGGKGTGKNIAIPNNSRVLFCGIDNKNNLYVNYLDATSGLGAMVEFIAGKGDAELTKVSTSFPGGLQFDNAQDLVGNDQLGPTTCIYELPSPTGSCKTATGDPLAVAIDKTHTDIYVSDASGGSVYEYTYPKFTLENTISSGLGASSPPFGVAADPSLPN